MLCVVRDLPSAFGAPSSNLHPAWKPTGDDDKGLGSDIGAVLYMFSTSFRACRVRQSRIKASRRWRGSSRRRVGAATVGAGSQTWYDGGRMTDEDSQVTLSKPSSAFLNLRPPLLGSQVILQRAAARYP